MARDLYLDLGMSAPNWSSWSKTNIVENKFLAQSIDFIPLTPDVSDKSRGHFAQDYAVTINTAKHIAMMAKTKRAHDYRNYFIECEKIAKGEIPLKAAITTYFYSKLPQNFTALFQPSILCVARDKMMIVNQITALYRYFLQQQLQHYLKYSM